MSERRGVLPCQRQSHVDWYGHECEFRVMAFELLGLNLEDLLNYCGRKFSLKTALMLADQLLRRFQYIHSKGYIHRDIKPENLLVGDGMQGNKVYVTDIGLAKEIREPMARSGDAWRRNGPLFGTTRYASITAHLSDGQYKLFPRDDMKSPGYVFIYFLRGSLPWQGLNADSQEQKDKLILEKSRQQLRSSMRVFPTSSRGILNASAPFAWMRHPTTHIYDACLATSFAVKDTSTIMSLTGQS
ncbi:kinase-like domain-containing protein [Lineolata rhizophorae]|uniref:non-specific serine/threonine protein kinase n=1 Tax=Lineolata rhizophorae TaxID=578093 RepID=A0A6A6NVQ5_9PEZI|nr:kinase-like domain-containing protein [Lineolata rhizophorae]